MTRVYEKADNINEAYAQCQHLVKTSVVGFLRKHRWDFDEALGYANLGFVKAHQKHDPAKGSFGARVCYLVWVEMMAGYKKECAARQVRGVSLCEEVHPVVAPEPNQLPQLTNQLGEDARRVLELLLGCPEEDPSPQQLLEPITQLGWDGQRTTTALQELRAAVA